MINLKELKMLSQLETEAINKADASQEQWKRSAYKTYDTYPGYIHDVELIGDIIRDEPEDIRLKLLSKEAITLLKSEVSGIHYPRHGGLYKSSYTHLYTYVLTQVERKFGMSSVVSGRTHVCTKSSDTSNIRGFSDTKDVKNYAREVMQSVVSRIKYMP